MSGINFQRIYHLKEVYQSAKQRATQELGRYLDYPDLILFNDIEKSLTFSSERLIPSAHSNRPRVMLLFSNPHPHSIQQGMFLSPNTKGRENLFWPVMADAGWLPIPAVERNPKKLANICLEAKYPGPFELIFYCYYSFPTNYPDDICKIFGSDYFNQVIAPESLDEFRQTVQAVSIDSVVVFNKEIFNLVSEDPVQSCLDRLIKGELIRSQVKGIHKTIPIFLTFPTGWRYHKLYLQLRRAGLDKIRTAIEAGSFK